ncbi:hypothetical protein CIB84_016196 [Bambusicola thoracicus]|uniref:Uncharacterized protein n=1 Tax=Bambusicola thoracicus TaxID=9083 RepID=A0A2P4S7I5_BAMTH|nr:hypothetical protein CIB84_016196 [Bambusicola thoracicus]
MQSAHLSQMRQPYS